jgi:hypothetical protein
MGEKDILLSVQPSADTSLGYYINFNVSER